MRSLRHSINVTLDGCCDHGAIRADEELHHHAANNLGQAEFGSGAVAMRDEPRT
jgi:hypothetical protein